MHRTPWPSALLLIGIISGGLTAHAGPADSLPPDGRLLTLRDALVRGIEHNLDLRIQEIALPISRGGVVVAEAAFDPALDARADARTGNTPLVAGVGDDVEWKRSTGAGAGIGKRFHTGFETRLGVETINTDGDLGGDLDNEYRSSLVLDLSQPLLRDRGVVVNTTDIRVSENRVRQAAYDVPGSGPAGRGGRRTHLPGPGARPGGPAAALPVPRPGAEARPRQPGETGRRHRPDHRGAAGRNGRGLPGRAELAARQAAEIAEARLKDLLDVRPEDALYSTAVADGPPAGDPGPVPNPAEALATALKDRPDLLSQRVEIKSQNIRLTFFDNQTLPRLDLAATLGVNGLSGHGSGTQAGPFGESLSDMATGEGYEWFAGLRFSYPLGNRAAEARERQAGLRKSQEIYRLKRLERAVETEVQTALVTVGAAWSGFASPSAS